MYGRGHRTRKNEFFFFTSIHAEFDYLLLISYYGCVKYVDLDVNNNFNTVRNSFCPPYEI